MRLMLAAVAISAVGLISACAVNDDHTGFACSSSTVSFDSAECTERVQNAGCTDGGFYFNGAEIPCCNFEHCETNPFPEYDEQ